MTLWRETIAALLVPRRIFPITVVCLPLIGAQYHFSDHDPAATALAGLVCVVFVAVSPWSWRALFEGDGGSLPAPIRVGFYAIVGGVPAVVGFSLPVLFEINDSLLTGGANAIVSAALSWVGGWGLARDIWLERSAREQAARAEALARDADRAHLLAVRAHLDPHFLFNTLNAIAEWCREDPEIAEQAILRLSGILREILGGISTPAWPLAQELDLARNVWSLHRTRDPGWFTVAWEVPEPPPEIAIPPLLLLPVVENAVKHGPALGHHGVLSLRAAVIDDALVITIANPGPYSGPRQGGLGVETVRKRIHLSYAARGSFDIKPHGDRTEVRIVLPITGPETHT